MNRVTTSGLISKELALGLACFSFLCGATASAFEVDTEVTIKPKFLTHKISKTYYDGITDDLLSAGWTVEELSRRTNPKKLKSTRRDLRKNAYFSNTVALVDTTLPGGYGTLINKTQSTALVSGYEYQTYAIDQDDLPAATLALQIPDSYSLSEPCLIVAASSGSRGIFGAVATVGHWALSSNCAIVYTDKGTGTGYYFIKDKAGFDIYGEYTTKNPDTVLSYVPLSKNLSEEFLKSYPNAIATKHSHSMKNKEKDFGKFVLQAAQFGVWQLEEHFKNASTKYKKPIVIAASISNGGVASLKAGELDSTGILDGIVASEPNIYPPKHPEIEIIENGERVKANSVNGLDYFTALNLFVPCTLLSDQALNAPLANWSSNQESSFKSWCDNLKKDGFIKGEGYKALAENSLLRLRELGLRDNHQILTPLMHKINIWHALTVNYINQFGRYSFNEMPCGDYYAFTDKSGKATEMPLELRETLFAESNGIPPNAGINIVSTNDLTPYQKAKCFYDLSKNTRVAKGVKEVVSEGDLNNIPTIILHGQNDNLIAPNNTSRPYYTKLLVSENHSPEKVRYYEITNAQHFDAFTALPFYADKYVPLHYYFERSLELMMSHLRKNTTLPPSQLVVTKRRARVEGNVEPLSKKHLPDISYKPDYPITVKGSSLIISGTE